MEVDPNADSDLVEASGTVTTLYYWAINGQSGSVWVGSDLEGKEYIVTSKSIYSTIIDRFRDVLLLVNNCCRVVFACSSSCFWMAICFW